MWRNIKISHPQDNGKEYWTPPRRGVITVDLQGEEVAGRVMRPISELMRVIGNVSVGVRVCGDR